MSQLQFITNNPGKFSEAQKVFPDLVQHKVDLTEVQSLDAREVSEHKLLEALKLWLDNFFMEDTSLVIHCLNWLPGPLIKWFLKSVETQWIRDMVKHQQDHSATATMIIGAVIDGKTHFFEASIQWSIVEPTWSEGFGRDALFIPDGETRTFGEMSLEEKAKYSSRFIALNKLKDFLEG